MDGRIVIVCYRPKPGQEAALDALMAAHTPKLRALGLATEREPILMRAADGTVIEVFEWVSEAAIEAAHGHPEVMALWAAYEEVCTYAPICTLTETDALFAGFQPWVQGDFARPEDDDTDDDDEMGAA